MQRFAGGGTDPAHQVPATDTRGGRARISPGRATGAACPYKYARTGCGHFRSDPSYLPELKSYLQQLLADRERLRAATDLQPWARAHAAPPDEQVSQVRELIRRIEADLETLSDADRAQIQQAVTAIKAARQTVSLGMPAIRPAAGDR